MEKKIRTILDRYLKGAASAKEKSFLNRWAEYIQEREPYKIENPTSVGYRLKLRIEQAKKASRRRRRIQHSFTLASIVALAVFSVLLTELFSKKVAVYEASIADLELVLEDQTLVVLKKGSVLQVLEGFNQEHRKIRLDGAAVFRVVKNDRLPFVVNSPHIITRVLGTEFHLHDYSGVSTYKVRVHSGKVAVENPSSSQLYVLYPEEELEGKNEYMTLLSSASEERYFQFAQTTLDEVISVLETYYQVVIQLEKPELGQLRVDGDYPQTELHSILRSICFLHQLELTTNNCGLILSQRHKESFNP